MRRVATSLLLCAAFVAGCGDSPEDEARDDGKQLGAAVRDLHDATSPEAANAALTAVLTARGDLREDARKYVDAEVQTQAAALRAAGEQFAADGDADQLRAQIQDIRAQADTLGDSDDSVRNEFWRGFQEGYEG